MSLEVKDVALVANLQTTGPLFISSHSGSIDHTAGMLLAARLIITTGIGENTSPMEKLYGPVPISEITHTNYQCYFYAVEMKQQPIPSAPFSTGRGTFIFTLIVSDDNAKEFLNYTSILEEILYSKKDKINFQNTFAGEIPDEIKNEINVTLKEIIEEVNLALKFATKYQGASLFDVRLFADLPENLAELGKKLLLHPRGLKLDEIDDKTTLKELYFSGLIKYEEKEGNILVIPK